MRKCGSYAVYICCEFLYFANLKLKVTEFNYLSPIFRMFNLKNARVSPWKFLNRKNLVQINSEIFKKDF